MKEAKFIRVQRRIVEVKNGNVQNFDSINEAKRHSRHIQMGEDGALGLGSVRVKAKNAK